MQYLHIGLEGFCLEWLGSSCDHGLLCPAIERVLDLFQVVSHLVKEILGMPHSVHGLCDEQVSAMAGNKAREVMSE